MNHLYLAAVVLGLCAFGVFLTLLIERLNKPLDAVLRDGEDIARRRVADREPVPVAEMVNELELESRFLNEAKILWKGLASEFGVPPECLRPDDSLSLIVTVDRDELREKTEAKWERTSLKGRISFQVFTERILLFVSGACKSADFIRVLDVATKPRSEDDWIDLILSMNVGALISTLAKCDRR